LKKMRYICGISKAPEIGKIKKDKIKNVLI